MATDDNYDFDFQQNRPLLEEVTILPGDQLTYGKEKISNFRFVILALHHAECTYNTMDSNGAVIGGLATTDEMCDAFIVYYPEIDLDFCSSEFPFSQLNEHFGIESYQGYEVESVAMKMCLVMNVF